MPPRTALFEIATATRPHNYVCRSCLAALTISTPPRRGYARKTKLTIKGEPPLRPRVKARQESFTAPPLYPEPKTKKTRPENAASQDTDQKKGPRIKYFEKDPRTGEITPIPEIEDDGEPEPTLADIAALGKRTMSKFDVLNETFAKLDALDGPLERLLEKHGPPGALEAYKAALKTYDDPDKNQDPKSGLPDFDAEPDPTVKAEEVIADLEKAMSGPESGSKHQKLSELRDAFSIVQDAWQTLKGAVTQPDDGKASQKVNLKADGKVKADSEGNINDDFVTETDDGDDMSYEEVFQAMHRKTNTSDKIGGVTSRSVRTREGGGDNSDAAMSSSSTTAKKGKATKGAEPAPDSQDSSFNGVVRVKSTSETDTADEDRRRPNIWIDQEVIQKKIPGAKWESLWALRESLLAKLEGSRKAIGKVWQERKRCDDLTQRAFTAFAPHLEAGYVTANTAFWQEMWTIFSNEGKWNPVRMVRIKLLGEIMVRAGAPITDAQKLLVIEAIFERGDTSKAINWWKRLVTPVGDLKTRTGLAFWELGIKLWCAHGDIGRAERAGKALLDRSSPSNPADTSVLLHLIQAYCINPDTAEKGFEFYRRMRDLATSLEKPMEIHEYDDVISLFLATGHTDYAMFAFTDMMFAGAVDLHGRVRLPSSVRNTFFFGKWLKRLIGAGDLDGAYKVIVLMQKNDVIPAAIQANGLIGALLRTRDSSNRTRAYTLAWAMINSREAFVNARRRFLIERQREATTLDWPISLIGDHPSSNWKHHTDDFKNGMVPRATTETFVIMATEYRERALFAQLEELFVAYKKCEMPGDAMMMNELLAGIVAQGKGGKARELFRSMVHEHGILPSTDTFAVLFSSLPVNKGPGPIQKNPALAASSRAEARSIFADMMASAWIYSEKHGRRARRPLSEPQAKLILHTFRKGEDLAGLSAALTGLRDVLEYRLTRGVVLEMIAGVVGIDRPLPRMKLAIVRATIVLQDLVTEMQARGQLPADATAEGMRDWKVLYNVLLQFFYQEMQARERQGIDGHTQTLLEQAQEEMGVTSVTIQAINEAPPLKVTAVSP